ncbi:MAG: glycosyltransferase family 39 protein [Aggregatilineales bacterium]
MNGLRHLAPAFTWVMVAVLLLAAALRFHALGAQSLWNDEGNSFVQATRGLIEIAEHAARDIHPPGYYWMLAIWRGLAGDSEFALRAPSVFASLLAIAVTFAIGRHLLGAGVGALAGLFAALNSFNIYYAQEARMYALLALWGAAGIWALLALLRRPTLRAALALGAINAAGLYTHYAYPLMLVVQGIVGILWLLALAHRPNAHKRGALGTFLAAMAFALLLFAPLLPTALAQVTGWPNTGEALPPAVALATTLRWLIFGITAGVPLAIPLILLPFGLLNPRDQRPLSWWRTCNPAIWAVLPPAIFLAAGLFREANLKFLLPSQLGMALWLAGSIGALWRISLRAPYSQGLYAASLNRAPKLAALASASWLVLILWSGVAPLYFEPAYQRADYRAIAAEIMARARPHDAIILNAPNQAEVFRYYFDPEASGLALHPLPEGLGGDDEATQQAVETIIAASERIYAIFWGEDERDPNRIVETTLDRLTFGISDDWYGDVRLAVYAAPVPPRVDADIEAVFGAANGRDRIGLAGYTLSDTQLARGDVLQVRLSWRPETAIRGRYKVFVQLLNDEGMLAAQRDSEPGSGLALTTTWSPGVVVIDQHGLLIPAELSPGTYALIIGLYDLDDPATRLRLDSGEDALRLDTITVE